MALKLEISHCGNGTDSKSYDPLNLRFPLICWDGALQEIQAVYSDVLSHFKVFLVPPQNNLNLYLGIRGQYLQKIVF